MHFLRYFLVFEFIFTVDTVILLSYSYHIIPYKQYLKLLATSADTIATIFKRKEIFFLVRYQQMRPY